MGSSQSRFATQPPPNAVIRDGRLISLDDAEELGSGTSLVSAPLTSDPDCLANTGAVRCFDVRPNSWGGWNAGLDWHWTRWDDEQAEGSGMFVYHGESQAVYATARLSDPGLCDGVKVYLHAEVTLQTGERELGEMSPHSCVYDSTPTRRAATPSTATSWSSFGRAYCREHSYTAADGTRRYSVIGLQMEVMESQDAATETELNLKHFEQAAQGAERAGCVGGE